MYMLCDEAIHAGVGCHGVYCVSIINIKCDGCFGGEMMRMCICSS